MFAPVAGVNPTKTTSHRVIIPFYVYAALSFIVGCVLLFTSSGAFTGPHFQPQLLAITHVMALGWGSMMILGASHQLVPVLIEGKLYSNVLAYLSFGFAGVGIILLVWAFYHFDFGWTAQVGGLLILIAFLFYLVNIIASMRNGNHKNVHATFVLAGTLWMILTISLGVLLIFNFTFNVLSMSSVSYLPLHAHLGIIGWFLMLVMGVGSRLIPMFLISKYSNEKRLWQVFYLVNAGLLLFYVSFILYPVQWLYIISTVLVVTAIALFIQFAFKAYKARIRKAVDPQVKIALGSSWMMLIPAIMLAFVFATSQLSTHFEKLVLVYGFCIFFGWISAIIFGMTFKTLPFILWNKKFHKKAGVSRTPNPRELFSQPVFRTMVGFYFGGFILFITGIFLANVLVLQIGAGLLIICSVLFNLNVFRMLRFKS
ncbi:MAG: cytochrome c oxidase subunit I [Chitinophagaceae bacterium]|nr:cytochrome c oxidase subunit I [Chitinophagaceae bacterium]